MSKIAFIKFAGLANGGVEKYLQTIAIMFKKQGHKIDYYYTNAAPITSSSWVHPDNNSDRQKVMQNNGINLVPVFVESRYHNDWINTNFFDIFDESRYEWLIIGGNGESEFPYNQLKEIKIIHTIHGEHVFNQDNIKKSILLCDWQAEKWVNNGGDTTKLEIIPPIVQIPDSYSKNFRNNNNIPVNAFVYGFHQRDDESIASTMSLEAFSKIQIENRYFIILGGAQIHRDYVVSNNIKNVIFKDATANPQDIHSFINALDVYAHARKDGEVCSACIIEALSQGKPVISHVAENMGHREQIEGCGQMCDSLEQYQEAMVMLQESRHLIPTCVNAKLRYNERYEYSMVRNKMLGLLE